jgi:hypothetical protein
MGDRLLARFLQERRKQEEEKPKTHLANGAQRSPPRTMLEVCGQNRTSYLIRTIVTSLFKLGPSYVPCRTHKQKYRNQLIQTMPCICVLQVLQTVGPVVARQPLLKSKNYSLRLSGAALPLLHACKSNDRSATV